MLFASRVGFSGTAELMVQLSNFKNPRWRYTRSAVAHNPCVSWAFLLDTSYCWQNMIKARLSHRSVLMCVHSSAAVEEGRNLINAEELEPPVQGPINREPDEKLFPERFVQKESGIRKLWVYSTDVLDFSLLSVRSGIGPFLANRAKSGSSQIFGWVWPDFADLLQCTQTICS